MRLIGCDIAYFPNIDDELLIKLAIKEQRLILTRDTHLIKRRNAKNNHYYIESDDYKLQLKQVIEHFKIDPYKDILTRCLRCNIEITTVDKNAIKEEVPLYVYETQDEFEKCPSCGRIYWDATHKEHMLKQLRLIVDG